MLFTPAKIERSKRDWQYIILHHSWSPDNKVTSDWEGIRRYHIEYCGWKNIGYHFGLEYAQDTLVLRFGRSLEENGAHTLGFNDKAIGICLIGNYDEQVPTIEQVNAVTELCKILIDMYGLTSKHILGHRETYALLNQEQQKTCPGIMFSINTIRERLLVNGF
ncbi:MAG: peptidoglycan recognition family protein [Candidatus Rickettsiella isopodorum]|nr:peptidoglycan recognition family protein [Candidatus Rickettsiella isopodorum]